MDERGSLRWEKPLVGALTTGCMFIELSSPETHFFAQHTSLCVSSPDDPGMDMLTGALN